MTYQTLIKCGLQWAVAISLGAVSVATLAAEQSQNVKGSQAGKIVTMRPAVTYKPPLHDEPLDRDGGRTRVLEDEATLLQVLAPDHTGLTLQAQPTLYWYARTPMATRFEITLIGKDKSEPLLQIAAGNEKVAGIQQLDLGDHDISLQPEATYQWSVTQVVDKGGESKDITASGIIEWMKTGEGLASRIKMSQGTDLVDVYASEGIWYDALETLSSMIDKSPEDQGLLAVRASLLEQIDFQAAAGK